MNDEFIIMIQNNYYFLLQKLSRVCVFVLTHEKKIKINLLIRIRF